MTNEKDDYKARVIRAVERNALRGICPICGYADHQNRVHPYAGYYAYPKENTRWCDGTREKRDASLAERERLLPDREENE